MPILRLQISTQADTMLPRDRMVMTPHFDVGFDPNSPTGPNGQSLCQDLLDALMAWQPGLGETTVKAYDAQGTVPVFPIGDAIANAGTMLTTGAPREIALCLSYFSERNRPRSRGRLYVPAGLIATGQLGRDPTLAQQEKVMALGPIFMNLGGTNVDWCVFSRADNVARPVTDYWCDNEWDVMRKRGLKSTSRLVAVTQEA